MRNEPKLRFRDFTDGWTITTFGKVCDKPQYGMNAAAIPFDGINKYIRITDIDEDSNTYKPNPIVSPKGILEDDFLLNEGDILFTRTGASTGKSYLYKKKDGDLYFAGFLIRFNVTKANPKIAFYQTLTSNYKNWVSITSIRSGQPGINAKEYAGYNFWIPRNSNEQTKISDFLSYIDKKLELLEIKLENLKLFKEGLIDELFNGIKSENNKYRIFDFCDIESSSIDKKSLPHEKNISLINYMDVYNNEYLTNKKIKNVVVSAKDNQIEKCLVNKGDLLITPTSETPEDIGHTSLIVEDLEEHVYSYHLMRIKFKNIEIIDEYKPLVFANSLMKNEFYKRATGSTRFTLSMKDFNEISFYLPSVKTQKKHSILYSNVSGSIDKTDEKIETLKQFKKGLLQQMFI